MNEQGYLAAEETFRSDEERLSALLERDARRYDKAFAEEEDVRLS